jgi:predicted NBD/HSP70 family sugar kinase
MSYRTGTAGLPRDLNRAAILRLIGTQGPIARTTIARRLGLSPATVTGVTRELLERGIVRVATRAPSRGGRPALLLEMVGGAATALGVKIAPQHLVAVLVDLEANVLQRHIEPFQPGAPAALDTLGEQLASWIPAASDDASFLGIGLGMPGIVDGATGVVDSPLLGWRGVELRRVLEEKLRVPIFVDNDVNTLAVAERLYGRGSSTDNFIAVTIGRGVGLGIVTGGDIYRGSRGAAGELGHVVVDPNGRRCTCGNRGCLESVVADPGLVLEARTRGVIGPRQGIERLRTLADGGDAAAARVFADAAAVLGRSVGNVVNVLCPELVLVSGEGTGAWRHLSAAFEEAFRSTLFPPLGKVAVEVDPWDDTKWAVGAAALVLRATLTATPEDAELNESMRARIGRTPGKEVLA